jgi:hypothetical protein
MIQALARKIINSFIVPTTVIMIVNYGRSVTLIVNYDRNSFIVQATDAKNCVIQIKFKLFGEIVTRGQCY